MEIMITRCGGKAGDDFYQELLPAAEPLLKPSCFRSHRSITGVNLRHKRVTAEQAPALHRGRSLGRELWRAAALVAALWLQELGLPVFPCAPRRWPQQASRSGTKLRTKPIPGIRRASTAPGHGLSPARAARSRRRPGRIAPDAHGGGHLFKLSTHAALKIS